MPVYEYVAIDNRGKNTKGNIDADNVRVARQKLRSKGIYPTEIREGKAVSKEKKQDISRYFESNKISNKALGVLTRQLATLLASGMPLVASLNALADQIDSVIARRILIEIRENVEEGISLADSLKKYPKSFPRLYVNMVSSGEASGTLDSVLENLADYLESQRALIDKVRSSLMYPAMMLILCTLVIIGLIVFVVPMIVDIFKKQGAELPLPTVIMIAVSEFFVSFWPALILAIVGGIWGLRRYYRTPAGKERIDRVLLKLPFYGPLSLKVGTARIARTLSTLLSSGVGLLAALDIVKNVVSNVHLARALENARDGVKEGKSLARELSKSGEFPKLLTNMIAVGEQSGKLEHMLNNASGLYEREVNATLSGITSLIEPLMIIFLGGIVLMIVISVLLPMMDLINIVQG